MRSFVLVMVCCALPGLAAPKKKGPAVAKQAVVIDAPPAVAKAIQATLAPRYAVTVNRSPMSDAPTTKEVRAVTGPVKAIAVVMARPQGDAWSITVLNGADGTPLDNQVFRAPPRKPVKALPKNVAAALVLAIATGQAVGAEPTPTPVVETKPEPAKPEPVKTEPKPEPKPAEPAKAVATPTPTPVEPTPSSPSVSSSSGTTFTPSPLPAVRLSLGLRAFARQLTWGGATENAATAYPWNPSVAVAFDGTWYPGAHFTSGVLGNIGATVQGDLVIGQSTTTTDRSARYPSRSQRFRIGAIFRQPFGSVFSLEATAGYSTQSFGLDPLATDGTTVRPAIPTVTFQGPRAGLGVRLVNLGPLSLDAMGGFKLPVRFGELATDVYFPQARGIAADATLGVSIQFAPNLHLRTAFEWNGYFLTLNPQEGARFQTPSGTDQYLGGNATVVFAM